MGDETGQISPLRRHRGPKVQRRKATEKNSPMRRRALSGRDLRVVERIVEGVTCRELAAEFGGHHSTWARVVAGQLHPDIGAEVKQHRERFRAETFARIEVVQREALERVRRALDNPDDRVALKAARQAIRDWQGPFAAAKHAGHAVVTVNSQVFTITDAIRLLNGQTPAAALPIIDGQPARPRPVGDGDFAPTPTDSG